MTNQLAFDFIKEIDEIARQEAEYEMRIRILEHERNQNLEMMQHYPPLPEELELWLLSGIRPARFVRDAECHECFFDWFDHCPDVFCASHRNRDNGGMYKVCVRDYFGKCVEWEMLPPEYPEVHEQIRASIDRARRIRRRRQSMEAQS